MKVWIIVAGIFIAAGIMTAVNIAYTLGVLKSIEETEHKCEFLKDQDDYIPGPEDIQKITQNIAIIAYSDKIQWETLERTNGFIQGGLALIDLQSKKLRKIEIQDFPKQKSFLPHGMYFEESSQRLFIVNHPSDNLGDSIEQFQVELANKSLDLISVQYQHTYRIDIQLTGLFNDIIKTGPGEILATSWFSNPWPLDGNGQGYLDASNQNNMDILMDKKLTNVYLCTFNEQCGQTRKSIDGQVIPDTEGNMNNGINWDRHNKVLVADTAGKIVTAYRYDKNNKNRLEKMNSFQISGHGDNIEYDIYDKNFYVSGFARQWDLMQLLGKPLDEKYSLMKDKENARKNKDFFASFMDKINVLPVNYQFEVQQEYLGFNSLVGTSVGIKYNDEVVFGSWFDRSLVFCNK